MRRFALLAVLVAAFAGGRALAKPKLAPADIAAELRKRHTKLMEDVTKIERAGSDFLEIQEMRATGKYVLNEWELKMEKSGRVDFHIFMERYRNDTLETLTLIEKFLGKEAYVDPLRRVFGEKLETPLEIAWDDVGLEDVIDELKDRFNADIDIDGDIEMGLSINFEGEMTLLAAVLQIENLFDVRIRVEGKKLWFVVPDREVK